MAKGDRERQARWERIYNDLNARIRRQSDAITRLLRGCQVAEEALRELAEGDLEPGSVRLRARRALDDLAANVALPNNQPPEEED